MAESMENESKPFHNQLYNLLRSVATSESVAKEASDLHKAAVTGDLTLLKQTLSSGTYDIDFQDDWDHTALFLAAQKGHAEIVNSLVSHGAKINADDVESLKSSNPMHCVRDVHIAQVLLKAGGDVNAKNLKGESPLHRSVMREDISIISFLLEHKADVNSQDNEGYSALHTCCNSSGSETMVTAMKYIISYGGDLNITDHFGMTPLHHLAKWSAFSNLAVKTLVSKGSDLFARDYRGNCPVHYYRSYTKYDEDSFIETLREFVVSPESANVTDFRGQTPLHLYSDTSVKVVNKLVKWGCQVNARDNKGKTALSVASGLQNTEEIIEHLLKVGADVNEQDDWGRTSLHEAAKAGSHVTTQLLISHNADPNVQDICGCTPLHDAALKQEARTVEMLLKNGASVNCTDINMSSALHFAAWTDSEKLAEYLLAHGANTKLKDNLGHSPLDVARLRGAKDVYRLLSSNDNESSIQSDVENIENVFALSNCGSKFFSFDSFSKMIENNEIKRKGQLEVQPFLKLILQSPDIGRGCDDAEGREIQLAMEEVVQNLADLIGKTDWRFRCSLLHAGSMSEGTKTRRPDEFDFIFALEEFSKHCYPVFSEMDSKTLSGVYIPAYYNSKKEDGSAVKIEERPEAVERTLSVSVSDYANITINNTVEAEEFLKFAGSTIIPVYKMYDGFAQLITKILFSKSFPKNPKLEILETTLEPAMTLCWRGCRYKDLEINVDLVPAIILRDWPEQFQKDNILLTPDILRIPSLIVPKMTAGTDEDLWRCSLAPEETAIFRKLKPAIRNSYIACKALICSFVCPQISFEGYEEAMNLYRQEHDSLSSEESIEIYENAEHILPSYMLKMMFFAAIESKAKTTGIQTIYMDDSEQSTDENEETKFNKEISLYGPSKEMYVAENCQDLDVTLVLDVFKRCAECLDRRFVPSFFNPKHNILGSRVMEHDLDKVAIIVKFILKLLD